MHSWGRQVVHVFDRGEAFSPWLGECLEMRLRFILCWTKTFLLRDSTGTTRKAWQITRGKRSWGQRQVWDARRQQWFQAGVLAVPVQHPDYATPLWLVVSRPGKGRPPWYLLTEQPIESEEDAWQVVFAYARRWQIEMTWRYDKSELAEDPSAAVALALALLVSSHRKAVPRGRSTALPLTMGHQSLMASLCPLSVLIPFVKFGMTHVCYD
jgi:hypothetical protein